MNPLFRLILGLAILPTAAALSARASDPAPTNRATHVAGTGTIKTKAQLDAVAESLQMEAIRLTPKVWTDLTVIEAVPHGARVKKGDLLIRLDLDKLRDQIEDLEQERAPAAVALELAVAEFENLKQTTPFKLEAARRSQRISDEDYSYFESIGRAQREKNAKFGVKSAQQRLDGANEELRQLEKMYKADDLTEDTEEIILKRQKFAVEAAQLGIESAQLSTERELKTILPRDQESLKTARRDQEIAMAYAEQTLPKTLLKKQQDLEKLKRDQRKADRKLTDLKYDLESLTVRSPSDGLVFYGASENGKWTTGAAVAKRLVPGAKLMPNEIVMTIVDPEKLQLKAVIAEAELSNFRNGLKGEAAPVAAADRKTPVQLDDVSNVPMPGGGFEARLSWEKDKPAQLMPGMSCKVTFAEIEKLAQVVVPKEAVFTDAAQKIVYVAKADGGHDKRVVKTGESDLKFTEITEGLTAGEKVLLKKPE